MQPGKKCLNIYREQEFQNFTISGCISKKPYWPKYCGVCTDERCCIPYKSKTIEVEFMCPNGAVLTWKYMWINACFCNLSCRNPNDIFADLGPYYEHNEIMNWDWEELRAQIFHCIVWCAPLESVLAGGISNYKSIPQAKARIFHWFVCLNVELMHILNGYFCATFKFCVGVNKKHLVCTGFDFASAKPRSLVQESILKISTRDTHQEDFIPLIRNVLWLENVYFLTFCSRMSKEPKGLWKYCINRFVWIF